MARLNNVEMESLFFKDGDCSSIVLSVVDPDENFNVSINNPVESILKIHASQDVDFAVVAIYALTGDRII